MGIKKTVFDEIAFGPRNFNLQNIHKLVNEEKSIDFENVSSIQDLLKELRNRLERKDEIKAEKGDVVRIVVDYDIKEGQIKWNYDTLRLEFFKRVPDEEVNKKVKEALARALGSK